MYETILEVNVTAALAGHDLGPFTSVAGDGTGRDGYQAVCRRCLRSVWINEAGRVYTLLDDACPGEADGEAGKRAFSHLRGVSAIILVTGGW